MGWDVGDLKRTRAATGIQNAVNSIKQVKEAAVDPAKFLKYPQYISGARVYLMIGGQLIGICTDFSWSIESGVETTTTVDSHIPFEVNPTALVIRANMAQVMDPDDSPESQGLWATMQSNPHQPNIELSVYDKLGTNLVNLRGMPASIRSNIRAGVLASRNVSFVGYMFTHNVAQGFEPYDDATFTKALRTAAENVSDATGGIL